MKPMLKAPGTKRLKLKYDQPLSSFAFNFNFRRYTMEAVAAAEKDQVGQGSKYVNRRRRRSLLAELSAADPARPILTREELAWVAGAMVGRCRLTR
jgi:hypothetical protein